MNFYTDDLPIIACSTGTSSNTAIAVIRLSGFKNLIALQKFFSFSLLKVKKRTSHLTNILFEDKVFDNGLLVYFPEGESYTGENVLELSVHGNQLNISRLLDLFLKESNFRPAHPGEFTYRALKNKKLSLSQVEGLDMLLNANSSLMLSQGLDILQGDLHAQYLALYDAFMKLKSAVEISIDFSEDVGAEETQKLFKNSFDRFFKIISALKTRTEGNISSLLAPEIAITGQTNAGKSSLFNILLNDDRSIVSSIAGTTRDYVSEVISIDGTNYKLIDTAGIRESSDVIEKIGIERALVILKRSFFKILVINPFETSAEYLTKFSGIDFDLLIVSHWDKVDFQEKLSEIDLTNFRSIYSLKANFLSGSIEPLRNNGGPIEPALNMNGPIEPLLKRLVADRFNLLTSNNPILIDRHRRSIDRVYNKSVLFSSNIEEMVDVAILSSEVNILGNDLAELIGIISPDDVLNSIFSNFCIGK